MQAIRFAALFGLVALLTAGAVAPTTQAAPADQWVGWTPIQQPAWDSSQPWYSRTVVVQPTGVVSSSVPITVVVPGNAPQSFVEPTFTTTFQQVVVPSLARVVPVDTLQSGLQVVQVQPNLHILAAPQFFCTTDAAANCQAMAFQLAQSTPGWTTVTTNGPLGYGVYVAYEA